jgi:hypothetical protein
MALYVCVQGYFNMMQHLVSFVVISRILYNFTFFAGQDVRNLIKKIGESDLSTPKAEEILGRIKDAGGVVSYTRDSNNFVDVLWIQTADMVDMLKKERPRLLSGASLASVEVWGVKYLSYVRFQVIFWALTVVL